MKFATVAGVDESYKRKSMSPRLVLTRTAESASGALKVPASAVSRVAPMIPDHAGIMLATPGGPAARRTRM